MNDTGVSLSVLVERFGGELKGDASLEVSGVAPLDVAQLGQLSFLSNSKFKARAMESRASALILTPTDAEFVRQGYAGSVILTAQPYVYFARVAQFFIDCAQVSPPQGVHPTAVVHPGATIDASAYIGPHVVVEEGAMIEARAYIGPGCTIGPGVRIGADSRLHARISMYAHCEIGKRCIVHAGAVIGADGFGFANDAGTWVKIPQTGRVLIGDDVEIGANTTIDRGALSDTVIEEGVKLDNQIQIGHNCRIGAHTAMAGCVGVAGSAHIGKYCTFGGAAMVLGHLTIADHVHISSGSMVTRSLNEPGVYTGIFPLSKNADWEKSAAVVRNLPTLREKMRNLEKQLKLHANKTEQDTEES